MTTPPQPINPVPDPDRVLWLTIRRALMMVVKGIEARYPAEEERKVA